MNFNLSINLFLLSMICLFMGTMGCTSIGFVNSEYKEVYQTDLASAFEKQFPDGYSVVMNGGPTKQLELVGSGFVFSNKISSGSWQVDFGWIYQSYSPLAMDLTVTQGANSTRILSSFDVTSSGLEVLGGYAFLGGLSLRGGFRRTIYSLMDTNFLSGIGIIEILQYQGVTGFEYAFGKGKDRLSGLFVRADYAVGLQKEVEVESASSFSLSVGYAW